MCNEQLAMCNEKLTIKNVQWTIIKIKDIKDFAGLWTNSACGEWTCKKSGSRKAYE